MTKLAFITSMLAAITGLGLMIPASPAYWPYYSTILVVHIIVSLLLSLVMIGVMLTHVRKAVKLATKGKARKQSGLWYLVVIMLAIGSGVFISVRSGFAVSWVLPLHLIAGVWCSLMGWKHSVKKTVKPLVNTQYELQKDTGA